MKIAIATMFTPNYGSDAEVSLINKLEYAAVHGYQVEYIDETLNSKFVPNWSKLFFIGELIKSKKYDWVFWIDIDAFIMTYNKKIEDLIDDNYDLIISEDEWAVNSGVFLIKCSENSQQLIENASSLTEFCKHDWTDNAAIIRCITPEQPLWDYESDANFYQIELQKRLSWHKNLNLSAKIKKIDQRFINSYSGHFYRRNVWQPGDFIMHAAGHGYLKNIPNAITFSQILKAAINKSNLKIHHRNELAHLFNILGYKGLGAEVGVLRGEYAQIIRSQWSGLLYLIDCWEFQNSGYIDAANSDNNKQLENLQSVKNLFAGDENVRLVRGFSPTVANNFADYTFDWIYIDANHSYEAVLSDLRAWYPKLRKGGMLCGHDFLDGNLPYGYFGVESAVRKFCDEIKCNLMVTDEHHPSWYFIKIR